MIIRLEVSRSRSYYWPLFVSKAKEFRSHKVTVSDGVEFHSVDAGSLEELLGIWSIVRSWKGVSVSVDGKPHDRRKFAWAMFDLSFRDLRTKEMLRGIVNKKAQQAEEQDALSRWRMGLGPEPGRRRPPEIMRCPHCGRTITWPQHS